MSRMPVLFLGHGSPMNAIEDNAWSRGWREAGQRLPRPKAVLMISAHWETRGVAVSVEFFGEFLRGRTDLGIRMRQNFLRTFPRLRIVRARGGFQGFEEGLPAAGLQRLQCGGVLLDFALLVGRGRCVGREVRCALSVNVQGGGKVLGFRESGGASIEILPEGAGLGITFGE